MKLKLPLVFLVALHGVAAAFVSGLVHADPTKVAAESQHPLEAPVVQVQVDVNGQTFGYLSELRLSTVLQQLQTDPALHWPAARLFQLGKQPAAGFEQTRMQALEQIRQLAVRWQRQPALSAQLTQFRQQVRQWQFALPIVQTLDLDLVLNHAERNPKLDAGHYLIQVEPRHDQFRLVQLTGDYQLPIQQGHAVYQYLSQLPAVAAAPAPFVYLLEHGRAPVQVPVADWNRITQPVAIGAVIFVPLNPDWLTAETADLNDKLLYLMQHRVFK